MGIEETRIRCIKLFLDRQQSLPAFVSERDVTTELNQANRNIVDCVADYLRELHKHTMQTLIKRFTEHFIKDTKIDFVLTVPAVWSYAAKNATLSVACKAGFPHDVRVISGGFVSLTGASLTFDFCNP